MVAAIIISVILICLTVIACVYMLCTRDIKDAKLRLKRAHTDNKHELDKIKLEHTLKMEQYSKAKKPAAANKASENEAAAFFKILNDPTLLYGEEDINDGVTGNN